MRVDPGRLARALHLEAGEIGAGQWTVTGGRRPHVVTAGACDCIDSEMHPNVECKHRLAVTLAALPAEMRVALRELVPRNRSAGQLVRQG